MKQSRESDNKHITTSYSAWLLVADPMHMLLDWTDEYNFKKPTHKKIEKIDQQLQN